jgi:hypothetical protein
MCGKHATGAWAGSLDSQCAFDILGFVGDGGFLLSIRYGRAICCPDFLWGQVAMHFSNYSTCLLLVGCERERRPWSPQVEEVQIQRSCVKRSNMLLFQKSASVKFEDGIGKST